MLWGQRMRIRLARNCMICVLRRVCGQARPELKKTKNQNLLHMREKSKRSASKSIVQRLFPRMLDFIAFVCV